jgi:hypothetical protein
LRLDGEAGDEEEKPAAPPLLPAEHFPGRDRKASAGTVELISDEGLILDIS